MKLNINKITLIVFFFFMGINFSLAQVQNTINTQYTQPVYTAQSQPFTQNNMYIPNTYSTPIQNTQTFPTFDSDVPCIDAKYDLRIGSRDYSLFGNVAKLQLFLYSNGIMYYPPTGYFGPITQVSLAKYQTLRNLAPTGILDFSTRTTLAKETCQNQNSNSSIYTSYNPFTINPVTTNPTITNPIITNPIITNPTINPSDVFGSR